MWLPSGVAALGLGLSEATRSEVGAETELTSPRADGSPTPGLSAEGGFSGSGERRKEKLREDYEARVAQTWVREIKSPEISSR